MIFRGQPGNHQGNLELPALCKIGHTEERVDSGSSHPWKTCSSKYRNMLFAIHSFIRFNSTPSQFRLSWPSQTEEKKKLSFQLHYHMKKMNYKPNSLMRTWFIPKNYNPSNPNIKSATTLILAFKMIQSSQIIKK